MILPYHDFTILFSYLAVSLERQSRQTCQDMCNPWELFVVTVDRGERDDLAGERPDVDKRMKAEMEARQLSVIRSYSGEDYAENKS